MGYERLGEHQYEYDGERDEPIARRPRIAPGRVTVTSRLPVQRRASAEVPASSTWRPRAPMPESIDAGVDPFAIHLLVEQPVQCASGPRTMDGPQVQQIAAAGVVGAGGAIPHAAAIAASLGAFAPIVHGIEAHVGGAAGYGGGADRR